MKRAFVISDLHLGGAEGFQMCPKRNRQALVTLLISLAKQKTADLDVNIVLAGDIVDFLAETPYASFTSGDQAAAEKLGEIFKNTANDGPEADVWTALRGVVESGCQLTLLLGNHDIELALPSPRKVLLDRLGKGRVELRCDGKPLHLGSTIVVHGNGDDTWNLVPYRKLNAFADGEIAEAGNIIVPGSELVMQVMNPIKQHHPWIDLLKPETSAALPVLAVLRPSSIKFFATVMKLYLKAWRRRRGMADDDISAADPTLNEHLLIARELAGLSEDIGVRKMFEPLATLWQDTLEGVRASVRRRLRRALRAYAPPTYFDTRSDPEWLPSADALLRAHNAKFVVMGHTHIAKRIHLSHGTYLNTGTWADLLALPPETWQDEPAGDAEFDTFVGDLASNQLTERRRLIQTYVQVDYNDDHSNSELYFADGRRVPDGDLMVTSK